MSMVDPTLDLSLERLRVALATMDEDHRGFETTRAEAPAFYSERSHALALAMHVQSLYSQIEDLFIRLIEKRELRLRKVGNWRPLLLEVAVANVPNGPRALLREETYAGLASMLRMHQAISADASAIKPGRLLSSLPAVRATVDRCIEDLSRRVSGARGR